MKNKKILFIILGLIVFYVIAWYFTEVRGVKVEKSFWSLTPSIIAISLALLTKEVYSALFMGIVTGSMLWCHFKPVKMFDKTFSGGVINVLSDTWNVGILVFLVILGMMVQLMNKTGGSKAFGEFVTKKIKTRKRVQLATVVLGILIFIDDYFNCLTVGSVMKPVTDRERISREKLAYIIDSTAAPVCIIAPISSWAAAVSGFVDNENGMNIFLKAIPYNYYALLTLVMIILVIAMDVSFGKMRSFEKRAETDEYWADKKINSTVESKKQASKDTYSHDKTKNGKVIDMIIPIILLIVFCTIGMIYTGGFFKGETFINAFANSDAAFGLAIGSASALILTIVFYMIRNIITFESAMSCLPNGFKQMVPAILILTFAWSLKAMTDNLGASTYVAGLVEGSATGFQVFLPCIIFLIAIGLSFATGTSWGTFGILIPIVVNCFQNTDYTMMIISISACMAGAVCGDHISPISDTTIMSSAGAECVHLDHVSTQIPYAIVVSSVSFICYIIAAVTKTTLFALPVGIVLIIGFLVIVKKKSQKKSSTKEGF